MKHYYILLSCITGLSTIQCSQNNTDPNFNPQVTMVQNNLDTIISQANLDPIIAQALTDEINNLSQQAQANIQQDAQEIRVAATFTTLLETAQKIIKANPSLSGYSSILNGLKYAARANSIQKLLIGAYPGQFKDELYYTDPYTESVGFILNDYFFNILCTALVTVIAPTSLGAALSLTTTSSPKQVLATHFTAGLAAHCAWLLEKKFIISPMQQAQVQQNQSQLSQNS
jgi:hypothetical protein